MNDYINILYVVFQLRPGGMENGIVNLINNSSEKFKHIICCLNKKGVIAHRVNKKANIHELNMRFGNDYSLPLKIVKLIHQEQIDIVRAFNEDPFFYSFLPAKIMQKPLLYYNGGRVLPEVRRRIIIEKMMANLTTKVIVPSEDLACYMTNKIGVRNENIRVIHNGVDLDRFSGYVNKIEKKNEIGIDKNNIVVGTVGRLTEQKDIPTFLKIAEKILEKNRKFTFIIVGDGELKEKLISLSKDFNVNNSVKFLGIRDDIEDLYQIMDYFVLTAKWEGMSNVILEAMASKKAVLATDVEGVRKIIESGKDGIVFKVGDVNGFVEFLLTCDDNEREELGKNALYKVNKYFSINNMVEEYERLYLQITNR